MLLVGECCSVFFSMQNFQGLITRYDKEEGRQGGREGGGENGNKVLNV